VGHVLSQLGNGWTQEVIADRLHADFADNSCTIPKDKGKPQSTIPWNSVFIYIFLVLP
jgi:hypothetical protein